MACGYFKAGVTDHEAVFHVTFRENPFAGQFTVACGLATAIDFLRAFHFTDTEVDYLGSQRGNDGKPLFDSRFLDYLRGLQLTCDVDAIPEGTLVFRERTADPGGGPIAFNASYSRRPCSTFSISKASLLQKRRVSAWLLKMIR